MADKIKPFAVFGGKCFYARGGFNDLIGNVDTVQEVVSLIKNLNDRYGDNEPIEWWQVVNLLTGEIIATSIDVPLGALDCQAPPYIHRYKDGELFQVHKPEEDD